MRNQKQDKRFLDSSRNGTYLHESKHNKTEPGPEAEAETKLRRTKQRLPIAHRRCPSVCSSTDAIVEDHSLSPAYHHYAMPRSGPHKPPEEKNPINVLLHSWISRLWNVRIRNEGGG